MMKKYPKRIVLGLSVMTAQAFFYNGIFYTYPQVLDQFYHVDKSQSGYYMMPISLASFLGPILFGKYFDSIGRRKMMFSSYLASGLMLLGIAWVFAKGEVGVYV